MGVLDRLVGPVQGKDIKNDAKLARFSSRDARFLTVNVSFISEVLFLQVEMHVLNRKVLVFYLEVYLCFIHSKL